MKRQKNMLVLLLVLVYSPAVQPCSRSFLPVSDPLPRKRVTVQMRPEEVSSKEEEAFGITSCGLK